MTDWYVCTVDRAGATSADFDRDNPGPYYILILTDTADPPAFWQTLFIPDQPVQDQMLATALTAISTGRQVRGWLDLPYFDPMGGGPQPGACHTLEVVVNLPPAD
jgi:hypothetical protein